MSDISAEPNMFEGIDKEIGGQKDVATIPEKQAEGGVVGPAGVSNGSGSTPSLVAGEDDSQAPNVPFFIEPKADLVWGASGTGKTINVGKVCKYVFKKYGKLTRVVSADGGGIGGNTGLAKAGILEFWALNAWKNPIANFERAIKGFWPLRLDDPDSPIVPPDAGTFEMYGFGAFEGLTSFGDMILDNLSGTQASLSQDPSYVFEQDGIKFAGENQSYYGFMQKELQRKVALSHLLKYEKVLWTAQESKGEEKGGGVVYGPMIGGKKATGKASGWFLNVFHMDVINKGEVTVDPVTKQKIQDVMHILFVKTHIDPQTLTPYPCKLRVPEEYSKGLKPYIDSGSVADAYLLLDSLYEKQEVEASKMMDEVKGLKERLLERAAKARLEEQARAEKRAKVFLKPQVSVPAMPGQPASVGVVPKVGVGVGPSQVPASATPVPIAIPGQQKVPSGPVKVAGIPTIQNVRKG